MKQFEYTKSSSSIFGDVKRPLMTIRIYSNIKKIWIPVYETLLDTGADISIIPKYLGKLIADDISSGKEIKIKGVVPYCELTAYIHNLKIQIINKEFEIPFAIADSDRVLAVLGRVKALDLFDIEFKKGDLIIFKD